MENSALNDQWHCVGLAYTQINECMLQNGESRMGLEWIGDAVELRGPHQRQNATIQTFPHAFFEHLMQLFHQYDSPSSNARCPDPESNDGK